MKRFRLIASVVLLFGLWFAAIGFTANGEGEMMDREKHSDKSEEAAKQFTVYPIGWVRKSDGRTTIEVAKKYLPALMGVEDCSEIWVLYWFDRNDTPQRRSILQVHPRGDERNPLRGVFATHSPVRPNLIAMTRCKVISVKENIIEIDTIDALADTPVLDIKN